MKNAMKLIKAKYHTLTEQECNEISELIHKIASNHEKEKWWKIECAIRAQVDITLSMLLADENFAEELEKEMKEHPEDWINEEA